MADQARLADLYACYFSEDEIVRLRVSSAMKRVTAAQPAWTMPFMDGLQSEIAAIDQASTQWTLASLFDLTKELLSASQRDRAIQIMKTNLEEHQDWIVLNTTMQVLFDWSGEDVGLGQWLGPQLERLQGDSRKSVAKRASKLFAKMRR
ncbi:MAG: hypothetical protein AB8G23_08280 [Myxococcota bacterium]